MLYRVNIDTAGGAAEIFRTLYTGVRRDDTKVRTKDFCIASAAACVTLEKSLNLESLSKAVNSNGCGTCKIGSTGKAGKVGSTGKTGGIPTLCRY